MDGLILKRNFVLLLNYRIELNLAPKTTSNESRRHCVSLACDFNLGEFIKKRKVKERAASH